VAQLHPFNSRSNDCKVLFHPPSSSIDYRELVASDQRLQNGIGIGLTIEPKEQ
jgi:hypothetical protein